MYVCMYVYLSIYLYVYIHIHTHTHICIYIYILNTYTYINIHVYMHTHIYMHMTYIYTCPRMRSLSSGSRESACLMSMRFCSALVMSELPWKGKTPSSDLAECMLPTWNTETSKNTVMNEARLSHLPFWGSSEVFFLIN